MIRCACWIGVSLVAFSGVAGADHRVLLQGDNRLVIVAEDGEEVWEKKWGGIHDIHLLENGNILTLQMNRRVVEIDRDTKRVIWSYDAAKSNGNEGQPVEVHSIQPLGEGRIMIAESGPARIIEIDRDGKLLKEIKLKVDNPHPHRDTRLARKLESGNYLVCHEGDGVVREYSGEGGAVVWEFPVPLFGKEPKPGHGPEAFGNQVFSALRLENGNTLIGSGNGHSVMEVSPEKEIVWVVHQNDLPGVMLGWVTTLEVLPTGTIVVGNCHAGPGQPLLIEFDPHARQVVWTFNGHETYGNNVSNSLLVDLAGQTIR